MPGKIVSELMVPAEYARAFRVDRGQTMRIIAVDGPQVGDMTVYNAHNYKEAYSADFSYLLNCRMGTGDAHQIQYLYSCQPWLSVMFEVTDDPVGDHWIMMGGRCNRTSYELMGVPYNGRSCQDNVAEAIRDFGMTEEDVADMFLLWMAVEYDERGRHHTVPSPVQKGQHIDMVARMDCLVALSACPASSVSNLNDGLNKPFKVEIYE